MARLSDSESPGEYLCITLPCGQSSWFRGPTAIFIEAQDCRRNSPVVSAGSVAEWPLLEKETGASLSDAAPKPLEADMAVGVREKC